MTIRDRKEYLETHSVQEASTFFGVSIRTIGRWRHDLGVKPRWSRNTPTVLVQRLGGMPLDDLVALLASTSTRQAARALDIGKSTASKWRNMLVPIEDQAWRNGSKILILKMLRVSESPMSAMILANRLNLSLHNTLWHLRSLETQGLVQRYPVNRRKYRWGAVGVTMPQEETV